MKDAYRKGNAVSELLFTWINPIFSIKDDEKLNVEYLSDFPKSFCAEKQHSKILAIWEENAGRKSRLLKTVFMAYLWVFIENATMQILRSIGEMVSPFLLQHLIDYLESSSDRPLSDRVWHGIILLLSLSFIKLMTSFLSQTIEIRQQFASDQTICGLSAMVYCKSLRMSSASGKKYSQGKLMNLMQLDCQRVAYFIHNISIGVNMITIVVLSLVLLYNFLGIVSLAGVGICILSLILNYFLAKISIRLDKVMMDAQDERMKKTTEAIQNIKVIKMYGWSNRFKSQIEDSRNLEVISIQKTILFSGLFILALYIYPKIVSIGTFFLYAALNNQITLGEVFASINVFGILANPLRDFPYILRNLVDAYLSAKRIQKFLESDEVPTVYDDSNCKAITQNKQLSPI